MYYNILISKMIIGQCEEISVNRIWIPLRNKLLVYLKSKRKMYFGSNLGSYSEIQ